MPILLKGKSAMHIIIMSHLSLSFLLFCSNPKFKNRFVNQIHVFVSAYNFALSLKPCLHQHFPIGFFRNLLLKTHNWAYHLLVSLLWF